MGSCKIVALRPSSNVNGGRCTNLVAQRRNVFEKCLTALQHASQCSTCNLSWCVKMKRVLVHFSTRAPFTHPADCQICAQFTALARCHAEKCQIRDCKVMLCDSFKQAKNTITPVYQFPIPTCNYSLI